ncbi:MAG: type II toxin-antitoxin system death-on-curing family toxin [Bryobacteraceae bacterium]
MIEPKWVSRKALEILHGKSLAMFGGAPGLRDSGLLDSALARPQHVFAYAESCSLAALAAAYTMGICRNHPFVDGNKRAGLLAMLVFLEINGYRLMISDTQATLDTIRTIEAVASGEISEEDLAQWIAARCAAKEKPGR